MPPPTSQARGTRASLSSTHHTTYVPRRKHTSAQPRLSLYGVPWRFLHFTADTGAGLPPVLSDAGRQYMEEDAYRWQTQQTTLDVIAAVPQLAKANTRPLRVLAYGDDSRSSSREYTEGAEGAEDDEDDEVKDIPPLPEFNPFSNTFAVALSPTAHNTAALDTASQPLDPAAVALAAKDEAEEGHDVSKKKRGMVAADLLSHFAQKEVVDDERERTRKRERSKWENTATHGGGVSSTASGGMDGGGVMVGGLGLSDESATARQARLTVDAEEEERRTRLSAAAEDDALTAADMPDMSDFIKLYEDEDEPSYPAIIWRQKERLTEAADVPASVVAELQAIDRERMAALTKRGNTAGSSHSRGRAAAGGSRDAAKPRHERKATLRFNLGLGKDYEEEHDDDSGPPADKQRTANHRFPALKKAAASKAAAASIAPRKVYGRQWYLPVVQWSTAEEEKERLEAASVERQQHDSTEGGTDTGDVEADGYHGDGWRDKVLALKSELPQLYCSRAFKAFLLRERQKDGGSGSGSGGRASRGRRLPHYLEGVEALDEKKEEEDERRAIQAAVLAITTPRISHSTSSSIATTRTSSAASTSAASGPLVPPSPTADSTTPTTTTIPAMTSGGSSMAAEDEREGDLLEYMREVRMRELNLAGLRWIKEREKAMEDRERRKKDRQKRLARAGSTAAGVVGAGGGGSEEVGDSGLDEEQVDLDKLFDIPDYPTSVAI